MPPTVHIGETQYPQPVHYLRHVVEAVEDVLSGLFALDGRLGFVLLGSFQTPKRVIRVIIAEEETPSLRPHGQQVLRWQALRL